MISKNTTRVLLSIPLAFALSASAQAATYYVSSAAGASDGYSGTYANYPLRTIAKVSQLAKSGDTVLFAKGSAWREKLVAVSGVTYGAYGSATAKPVLQGSVNLGGLTWTLYKDNIYVASTISLGTDIKITQVFNNDARLVRSRHPNLDTRYLANQVHDVASATNVTIKPPAGSVPTTAVLDRALMHHVIDGYYLNDYEVVGSGSSATSLYAKRIPIDARYPEAKGYIYEVKQGALFWLENKLWMLDAENEWYFADHLNNDSAEGQDKIYLRLPGGVSPQGKTIMASIAKMDASGKLVPTAGIDCIQCVGTKIDGLEIREAATEGVYAPLNKQLSLTNVDIIRPGGKGVSLAGTSDSTMDGIKVESSMREGVWMGNNRYASTQSGPYVNLNNSTITDAGRDFYAEAAVQGGHKASIQNNDIIRSAYIGIWSGMGSYVFGNYLEDSCMEFGDCAALYLNSADGTYSTTLNTEIPAAFPQDTTFSYNIVNRTASTDYTKVGNKNGIYLDGFARKVSATDNFVVGAENGIFSNSGSSLFIQRNVVFGNRGYAMHFQELDMRSPPGQHPIPAGCDYWQLSNCMNDKRDFSVDNHFDYNIFGGDNFRPLVSFTSDFGNTSDFGAFQGNRYISFHNPIIASDRPYQNGTPTGPVYGANLRSGYNLRQWQAMGRDTGGSQQANYFWVQPVANSSNLLSNGHFNTNIDGWSSWLNADLAMAPATACVTDKCLAITFNANSQPTTTGLKHYMFRTASGYPVSSGGGKAYVVSFDAKSSDASGANSLSSYFSSGIGIMESTVGTSKLGSTWQHYTQHIFVEKNISDPAGVFFLDMAGPQGSTIYLDNLSVVEASAVGTTADRTHAIINKERAAQSFNCPAANQSLCGQYKNLQTNADVVFPLSVPARTAVLIGLKNAAGQDDDGDGIPNGNVSANQYDRCPGTSTALTVGTTPSGCAVGQ